MARTSTAVRGHRGIYAVENGGKRRCMISYRVAGRQRTKTLDTLKEAVAFQATVRDPRRLRQLRQLEAGRLALGDYFPMWLSRKRGLSPATQRLYRDVGRKYIESSPLGRRAVAEIRRDDVEDWVSGLVASGVGAAMTDKAYRTLRACLESAVLEGRALSNPARRISLPQPTDRQPFFLTEDQVDAIAREVPQRYRALVYFLAYTGARIGEASALRVKSLDLEASRILISESSSEVAGHKLPPGRTKTKKVRSVDLSQELAAELTSHLDRYGPRASGVLDPEGFVFSGERGAPIRQGNWRRRVFQSACDRLGILRGTAGDRRAPRVHDLRHTAASLAAKAGYSLHEVKEMLGHSTIKTTSDRYLHLFDDARRDRASSLGGLMVAARSRSTSTVPSP